MLYVHPGVARQGIGTMLYDAIEKLAGARGAKQLTVDASDTSRPFFEKRGFEGVQRNTVLLGEEWLGNTLMKKVLGKAEAARTLQ
jgi:putative acetyltransferase